MKTRLFRLTALVVAFLLLAGLSGAGAALAQTGPSAPRGGIPILCHIYVWAAAPGATHDGTSWTDAYLDLNDALADSSCSTIWVAQGIYVPGTNSTDYFHLPAGKAVFGGFSGIETAFDQRNFLANVTIISGDITGDDLNTDGNHIAETPADIRTTNSNLLVNINCGAVVTNQTVLDGFTLTGAQVSGALDAAGGGAGAQCSPTLSNLVFSGNHSDSSAGALDIFAASGNPSTPQLNNLVFSGNTADGNGGAVYLGHTSPLFQAVTFKGNSSGSLGGAIFSTASAGETISPKLVYVTFIDNTAANGGAIVNYSSGGGQNNPVIANSTFYDNHATSRGGALYGFATGASTTSATLTNVTFHGNHADGTGGAIAGSTSDGNTVNTTLHNVILWGDTAVSGGPELYNDHSTDSIDHSIVQGGCDSIPGVTCSDGNLNANPLLGALRNNGGDTLTMALISGSPAIDAGDNAACMVYPVDIIDQRYEPRIVDGNGDGTETCDIGSVEYQARVFADLPVTGKEWMEPWVEAFYYAGVTTGCGSGPLIYCPENNVTRAEMAVFILRAMHGAGYAPPAATGVFDDVPVAGKEWMQPWIEDFHAHGITTGCGSAPLIYCPENNVTRAEMAVFVLRAIHTLPYAPPPPAVPGVFDDVPVTGKEWMQGWIEDFYGHSITTGCGSSPMRYCPENNVTRAEMAVFIDRAFGLYP